MSTFVFVCEDEATKHEGVELPTEGDGSLLLSVLESQYEGALGLKYRYAHIKLKPLYYDIKAHYI